MSVRVALRAMLAGVIGSGCISAVPAFAADLPVKAAPVPFVTEAPAVDGINGKVEGFGGSSSRKSLYGAAGSLSIPLQQRYGLQIDGTAASLGGRSFGAVGGHLFWRDPAKGLLGFYGSTSYWNNLGGIRVHHFGVEGGWYLDRVSLDGVAGVEGGNTVTATVGPVIQTFSIGTRFFDQIDLSYYLQDNFKVSIGHRYLGGKNAAALGGEYGFGLGGGKMASVFVEGRLGEGNFRSVWGGLRFYLGQRDKTLIQRHRQDDPKIWGVDETSGGPNNGTETPVPPVITPPNPCQQVPLGGALAISCIP
jgi:hypothetical protein